VDEEDRRCRRRAPVPDTEAEIVAEEDFDR
jgi:hypothetical protein